jgi:hypothetical protein
MLNLLATLVVTALPASPGAFPACPDPTPPAVEACDEAVPLDLWYRMSRFADPEPGSAAADPAAPARADRGSPSCDAPQGPVYVPSPDAPPVALFQLATLLPPEFPSHFSADTRDLPARAVAPPERPPRV